MIKAVVGKNVAGEELRWQLLTEEELVSLASTDALFGGAQTFVLEGALYGERGEEFVDLLEVFAESPHTFIFKEEKLLKAETEALKKAGAKIELEKKAEKKDKKGLWLALMASWREGEKPEAVAGLMAWKARQMKDIKLSRDLVCLYHDSHRGAGELELLLERFALKL